VGDAFILTVAVFNLRYSVNAAKYHGDTDHSISIGGRPLGIHHRQNFSSYCPSPIIPQYL